MANSESAVKERSGIDLKSPKKYKVLIHNDDFTPMDFVVMILTTIFRKSEPEAVELMLSVHHSDKAIAGVYTYDIAATKTEQAMNMARSEGYPLRLSYEPE